MNNKKQQQTVESVLEKPGSLTAGDETVPQLTIDKISAPVTVDENVVQQIESHVDEITAESDAIQQTE